MSCSRLFLPLLLILLALGGAGCGAGPQPHVVRLYEGPPHPRTEVAVLWYMSDSPLVIQEVDGRSDTGFVPRCWRKDACVIELLPGKHTLTTGFHEVLVHEPEAGDPDPRSKKVIVFTSAKDKRVDLDVAAGAFYSITAKRTEPDFEGSLRSRGIKRLGAQNVTLNDEEWAVEISPSGDPDHAVGE